MEKPTLLCIETSWRTVAFHTHKKVLWKQLSAARRMAAVVTMKDFLGAEEVQQIS